MCHEPTAASIRSRLVSLQSLPDVPTPLLIQYNDGCIALTRYGSRNDYEERSRVSSHTAQKGKDIDSPFDGIQTENANTTDPVLIEKNLALGEHVKKGESLISFRKRFEAKQGGCLSRRYQRYSL
jgi:hypothetical protein